ncbi:MAG: hypothetical protein JSR27_06235 [Proteobacteria bacterium]|nr:hypothetical protein [Pseudomonadota bacterium]
MTGDKPDWDYWLNLAEVPLEDAICLSLGYSPRILVELDELYVRADRAQILRTFSANFAARHQAARTHITVGNLEARFNSSKDKYFVSLVDFRDWAQSLPLPFTFPEEFPKPTPKAAPAETSTAADSADSRPLNPKREKTLLRIIRALDALSELPERGAAKEVVAKLQGLGFRSPDDDTIRDVIGEARKLEPD